MTLIPSPAYRWTASLFLLTIAGALVGAGLWQWVHFRLGDEWVPVLLGIVFAALGVGIWRSYIRADDVSIVVNLLVTRHYDRRDVAAIQIGRFQVAYYTGSGRRVRFLRANGTVLFVTFLEWWGKAQIEALGTYLGVPIEGA
jgi:hypothetical protein